MIRRPASQRYWPTAEHVRLLRAFAPGGRQDLGAWADWLAQGKLDSVEADVFQLLPALFLRAGDRFDPGVAAKLRGVYRYAWLRDQLARRELLRILPPLEELGLRPVLLDGPGLALFHYPGPGARFWPSLDFLIAAGDLPAAANVLAGAGWATARPSRALYRRPFRPSVIYRLPSRLELTVTCHPFLAGASSGEDVFRARAVTRELAGAIVRVPDATDLLIGACVRGRLASPQGVCLWVADALTLLDAVPPTIDWPAVLVRSREGDVLPAVRDSLIHLHRELGAGIPGTLIAELQGLAESPAEARKYRELATWNRSRLPIRRVLARYVRRPSGLAARPPFVCYYGHHRAASTYTHHVIQAVCRDIGWPFVILHTAAAPDRESARRRAGRSPRFLIYTNAEVSLLRHLRDCPGFHVIRDPRDIVVSSYFSHLHSHPTKHWAALGAHRRHLESVSRDEGLLYEIETCRSEQFAAMYEWDYASPNVLELRMEDLVRAPDETFLAIFDHLGMLDESQDAGENPVLHLVDRAGRAIRRVQDAASLRLRGTPAERPFGRTLAGIRPERLRAIVHRHDFLRKTGGRPVGSEDVRSHYRKGVAGDWRIHFTSVHIAAFKARYGDLLVKLGYEADDHW